ncbi:hypothetical protein QR680_010219 [Steinernema hermaphroditum]|uniref:Uncharacterized protein n=1 Tax=Steinernema hermaphroditum TaxID=289476 RepID=A0AA39IQ36_9BILA|nr:hypothetical protein QR680_010219 [Steinernema hermaphroditum]
MSDIAFVLLDYVRISTSAIHMPMFLISTYVMLFKTPKPMRPNNFYLLNINFWHHMLAFLCTTIARTRIENFEGLVCLSFEPLLWSRLPFGIDTYSTIVIVGSINTGLSPLFSFANSFHIVHYTLNQKKERPRLVLVYSIVVTVVVTFVNTALCSWSHIPTISNVDGRYLYCLIESQSLYRFVAWKCAYLFTLAATVLLVLLILWKIRAYFNTLSRHLVTNNVITVQQQFLRTLILIAIVTFFSTVVPHFIVSLDMIFWSEAWSFNVIADLVPLIAIVQNVLSIFTVRPYRHIFLFKSCRVKNVITSVT